ncbi:unnamed protein product [Leptosia nina]|uniref:Uncharacterized protein n=1 Tax=Leptosia nina TaxID=320188 RepID=A0AAV1IU74_9NEOP
MSACKSFKSTALIILIIINYVQLNSDFDPVAFLVDDNDFDATPNFETTDEPVFSDGLWMCGDCLGIQESNIKYSESFDVDTNEQNEENIEVQFAVSLSDMRCITVSTDNISNVALVSGSCIGDTVTLSVSGTPHYDVTVY